MANVDKYCTIWCSNDEYDFWVSNSKLGCAWYVVATKKGTTEYSTQAGFNTRKAARHCAEVWAGWMH